MVEQVYRRLAQLTSHVTQISVRGFPFWSKLSYWQVDAVMVASIFRERTKSCIVLPCLCGPFLAHQSSLALKVRHKYFLLRCMIVTADCTSLDERQIERPLDGRRDFHAKSCLRFANPDWAKS